MATTVRITETYDLKTTLNKVGLIGIHTPTGALLNRLYPGLVRNHNFVRFLKCDVTGACASVLPADPLSVGVSAGDVAPEDMFNPILYRAVTNDSFDTIMAKIYDQTDVATLGSLNEGTIGNNYQSTNAFTAYYGLLAENGKYRKVMPQSGFRITGLVPICHTLISTYGNTTPIGNFVGYEKIDDQSSTDAYIPQLADTPSVAENNLSSDPYNSHNAVVFRGKSVRMPKLPLHFVSKNPSAMEDIPNLPRTFVLAMIVPPARLHEFYYRMRVTWTIRFENVISILNSADLSGLVGTGNLSYAKNYTYASSKADLENNQNMVDTDGVEIKKIMES